MRKENSVRGSGLSSATYLQTEEGLAMLNEFLVTILSLDDVTAGDPTLHHISTYIGEQYDAPQTQSLLIAYYLMLGNDIDTARQNARARTIRVKRYYSYDRPGANRKDTTYWRGARTIVSYIKHLSSQHAHGEISDDEIATIIDQLHRGKYSLDDQQHMLDLHTQNGETLPTFIHPLYTGKLLYQLSQGVSRQAIYDADPRLRRAPPLSPEQAHYHDQIIDEILSFHAEVEKRSIPQN